MITTRDLPKEPMVKSIIGSVCAGSNLKLDSGGSGFATLELSLHTSDPNVGAFLDALRGYKSRVTITIIEEATNDNLPT